MKIYVNGRFLTQPLSGVQRYAHEILRALDRQLDLDSGQHCVEVLVPEAVEMPDWHTLKLRVVPGGRGHLWEQTNLVRASRDGVLVSLGNAGPMRHTAQVLCLHDAHLYEMPEAFSASYRMLHRVLRPVLARRAAALLSVSKTSARALSHHLGVPIERFQIVPNAADHVLRLPIGANVPSRYGLAPGGYLLSVGNQSPNKNLAALCAAHARARGDVPPLVIVGAAAPGVTSAFAGQGAIVLGRVPDADLRGLYEGAEGFVFPSLKEGFGIPPLEAMQLGVPVMAAHSGALPEVLGDAPLWFDPRDQGDMARTLEHFAQINPATLVRKGAEQAERYSWQRSAAQLWEIVQEVSERRVQTLAA